ncbi:MAG: CDP-alcohol phosphatidyltransferase family protein [Bacteroidia bacterium]
MIRKNIPNAITCGNLLCGCLAIVQAFEGNLVWAAYLVGIAAVLDFFDGFAARLLHVSSPIGKDLDSLADMVTFGVVPGIVMFQWLTAIFYKTLDRAEFSIYEMQGFGRYGALRYIAFLIPIFSAVRLAKFNNDVRQSDSFIGLPTPANAAFICSIPLVVEFCCEEFAGSVAPYLTPLGMFLTNPWVIVPVICVFSFLLISELPLFALKFKNFGWADNKIRYVFLALALLLLIAFQFVGIPLVIIAYILLSAVNNLLIKKAA